MAHERQDWQNWLAAHGPAAQLYARQFVASREDAQDALHDGFVRFWPRRATARDAVAFLYACVRSAAMDQRRHAARQRRKHAGARPADHADASDAGLAQRDAVEAALAQLPEAQREAVVLRIWGGLTFQQMAEATGESINTMAARHRYAMEKLEGLLSPELRHER